MTLREYIYERHTPKAGASTQDRVNSLEAICAMANHVRDCDAEGLKGWRLKREAIRRYRKFEGVRYGFTSWIAVISLVINAVRLFIAWRNKT